MTRPSGNILRIGCGGTQLVVELQAFTGLTALHCGISPFREIRVFNRDSSPAAEQAFILKIHGDSTGMTIRTPAPAPGESIRIDPVDWTPFTDLARRISRPEQRTVELIASGGCGNPARGAITIIGPWDWVSDDTDLITFAARVDPGNPFVDALVFQSRSGSKAMRTIPETDIPDSPGDDPEWSVMERLYEHIRGACGIAYVEPEVSPLFSTGRSTQSIRPPHTIFGGDITMHTGTATCLDIALFYAACLENAGIQPVIILLSHDSGPEWIHAMAGAWAGTQPGARPIVSDPREIAEEIEAGYLRIVETTGMAHSPDSPNHVNFNDACRLAAERVRNAADIRMIDIGAARPPRGSITPMTVHYHPDADRALFAARRFAMSRHRDVLELTHLLYGLVHSRGKITTRLVTAAGLSMTTIEHILESIVKPRNGSGVPVHSKNLNACLRLADDYAWQRHALSIGESDLLWALMEKGADSRVFTAVCHRAGLDLPHLGRILATISKEPRTPFPSTIIDDLSG